MRKNLIHLSKFLSLVLRHKPETLGLTLDSRGWVAVDDLLTAAQEHGRPISRAQLDEVVATNDKKRFAFSQDGRRIRASQGHSVLVDLALEAVEPPEFLYHGTTIRFLDSIRARGLESRGRQHVHLSADRQTARTVGSRHGRPVVLRVAARALFATGHRFFLSENGVWLTDHVPPAALEEDPKVS